MLKKLKDTGVSKAAQIAINNYIKEFGTVEYLKLDSEAKTMEIEIMLDGEIEPLRVKVGHYEIIQENNQYFLKVEQIQTSRAWINSIVSSYLTHKTFSIPSKYASIIEKII